MNKLKDMYLMYSKLEKNTNNLESNFIVLVCCNNPSNDFIFMANNEKNLLTSLKIVFKNTKIIRVYISQSINNETIKEIEDTFGCQVYICTNNFKTSKRIKSDMPNVDQLCNEEPQFKTFYTTLVENNTSITKITKNLISEKILEINTKNKVVLSNFGKSIFSKDFNNTSGIIINEKEINKKLVYSSKMKMFGSLLDLRENVPMYIYVKLPKFQSRDKLISTVNKPVTYELLQEIIDYFLSINDFESSIPMEIEITPISLIFMVRENGEQAIRKFFEKYYGLCSKEQLIKKIEQAGLSLEKKSTGGTTKYILLYKKTINEYDKTWDSIDMTIIDIANRKEYFTRSLINEELNISPRNANNHLNKLVTQKVILQTGVGRATKYYKNKSI